MRRNAFGIVELLIVIIIAIIIYVNCFHSQNGRKNPFEDRVRVKTQQQAAEEKIQEIERLQNIKKDIELNLQEGN